MQEILQQENGVSAPATFRRQPGWQQDSSLQASEDSQFPVFILGYRDHLITEK